jgi:hypothetical protein
MTATEYIDEDDDTEATAPAEPLVETASEARDATEPKPEVSRKSRPRPPKRPRAAAVGPSPDEDGGDDDASSSPPSLRPDAVNDDIPDEGAEVPPPPPPRAPKTARKTVRPRPAVTADAEDADNEGKEEEGENVRRGGAPPAPLCLPPSFIAIDRLPGLIAAVEARPDFEFVTRSARKSSVVTPDLTATARDLAGVLGWTDAADAVPGLLRRAAAPRITVFDCFGAQALEDAFSVGNGLVIQDLLLRCLRRFRDNKREETRAIVRLLHSREVVNVYWQNAKVAVTTWPAECRDDLLATVLVLRTKMSPAAAAAGAAAGRPVKRARVSPFTASSSSSSSSSAPATADGGGAGHAISDSVEHPDEGRCDQGVQVNLDRGGGGHGRRRKTNNRSVRVTTPTDDGLALNHDRCRVNVLRSFDDMCAACLSQMAVVIGGAFDDVRLS